MPAPGTASLITEHMVLANRHAFWRYSTKRTSYAGSMPAPGTASLITEHMVLANRHAFWRYSTKRTSYAGSMPAPGTRYRRFLHGSAFFPS